ncbi:hypothetical protein NKH73_11890 [Mesorhizobium sp. M0938]|uniref:hypothetical protein n=1 Tax=unclassified Mesorhizobium TaxID=325217 RepID=UPI0033388BC7
MSIGPDILSTVAAAGSAFSGAFGKVIISYLRDLGFPTTIGKFDLAKMLDDSETSVDERLLKIDQARQNLADALGAIEDLSTQANRQKSELEALTVAVANALDEKTVATSELSAIRTLASLDTRAMQKAFSSSYAFAEMVRTGFLVLPRHLGFAYCVVHF